MLIDLLFLFCLALAVFKGYRQGLLPAVFALLAWALGLIVAFRYSSEAGDLLSGTLQISARWRYLIAFLLIFTLTGVIVRLAGLMVAKAMQLAMLGWVNRLGGILFYVLLYGLLFGVALAVAAELNLLTGEAASASWVYRALQPFIITLKQLF